MEGSEHMKMNSLKELEERAKRLLQEAPEDGSDSDREAHAYWEGYLAAVKDVRAIHNRAATKILAALDDLEAFVEG